MEMNESNQPSLADTNFAHPAMRVNESVSNTNAAIATSFNQPELAEDNDDVTVDEYLTQLQAAKKEKAKKDMLYGGLWCVGGIVATLADIGYFFWGAIVFGGIQFFRGLANSRSED